MKSKEELRKPDIDRLITTMRGGIADRVPHFEVLIDERNTEAILGRNIGTTLSASARTSGNTCFIPPIEPEDYIEIVKKIGQDAIGFEALWPPLKYKDEKGNLHLIEDGRIKSMEDFEKAIKPTWEDYKFRKEWLDRYTRAVKGTGIGTFILTGCVFTSCYTWFTGFEDFFVLCYTDRELIDAMLDFTVEYYLKIIDMAVDAGLSFIYLADDLAFKTGTFISPELMKEIWLPKYRKLVKPIKQAGVPLMFHSDGNLESILGDMLIPMGIDVLNPIEPYGMDIFDVKRKYGDKITLAGNIDIAGPLAFGTKEETVSEVVEKIEKLKIGGRYICATSHSVTNDVLPENYMAMIEAILEHGRY